MARNDREQTVRWGVIGLGWFGAIHADVLSMHARRNLSKSIGESVLNKISALIRSDRIPSS